jgi:predicted DNA-binding protein with PD1-like motif
MASVECATGRRIVASLQKGADLLAEIERLAEEHGIGFGEVRGIGSLDRASVTFYDQAAKEDRALEFERPMMLLALAGTVLQQDGATGAHVHIVLADDSGAAYGGDISLGCRVFSCELVLEELPAGAVGRREDPATGLARLQFD